MDGLELPTTTACMATRRTAVASTCPGLTKGKYLSRRQRRFNVYMACSRIAVEWGFGKMDEQWEMFSVTKRQKVLKSPVGKRYLVAAFLTNCHTCLHRAV